MIHVLLWLKLAGLLIAMLLLVCVWLYRCARDAEDVADRWKAEAGEWQSLARDANASAARAAGFAQDAVNALAARQEDIDARDAEIERLYGACKYFVEQEQNKHRLWREAVHAGEREPFVRQVAETIRHARDMRPTQWEN